MSPEDFSKHLCEAVVHLRKSLNASSQEYINGRPLPELVLVFPSWPAAVAFKTSVFREFRPTPEATQLLIDKDHFELMGVHIRLKVPAHADHGPMFDYSTYNRGSVADTVALYDVRPGEPIPTSGDVVGSFAPVRGPSENGR